MQKLYYSIKEISQLVSEEQHILRYWEKEFSPLKPKKNRAGNRIFSEKDLFIIKSIKKLLREDKLSLKGAKEQLDKILELKNQNDGNSAKINNEDLNQNTNKQVILNERNNNENVLLSDIRKLLMDIKVLIN